MPPTRTRQTADVCHLLREDPELAEALAPAARHAAAERIVVGALRVGPGPWRNRRVEGLDAGLGLLMLEGIMLHRVGIDRRFGAELIGEGDVLRPPYHAGESALTTTNDWLVLKPARLAVLDEAFVRQLAEYPTVAGRLFRRAVDRSRQLAVNMAIVHQARVDVRLHMLFWHLADRWGRVRSDGVVIPLKLTHAVLSDLVAARRPTVTSALSDLSRRGEVRAIPDGWLLSGAPPVTGRSGLGPAMV
ncbi:MAG TPA: Crp/Fnr family transcriptional regulator [Solirubrobacteraceae bacterium]|nr:Crp/Fnr family transcriptional regulator [Solirubrobacteraceae bacterium]